MRKTTTTKVPTHRAKRPRGWNARPGAAERRRLGRLLLSFRSLNELRVVGALLLLDPPEGEASRDELRGVISKALRRRTAVGESAISRGIDTAEENETVVRERVGKQGYRYFVGRKIRRLVPGESEVRG